MGAMGRRIVVISGLLQKLSLAESTDGNADGGSTNSEKQPEKTCDVCHLPGHGLCPWA